MRCSECGYWNDPRDKRCGRCGRRLLGPSAGATTRREMEEAEALPTAPEPAPPKPAPEPAWKQELQQRLAGYREKRKKRAQSEPASSEPAGRDASKEAPKGSWIDLPAPKSSHADEKERKLPPPRGSRIPPPPPSLKERLPAKPEAEPRSPETQATPERSRALPPSFSAKKTRRLPDRRLSEGADSATASAPGAERRLPLEPHIAPRGDESTGAKTDDRPRSELERRSAPLTMRFVASLMDVALAAVALGVFAGVASWIDRTSLAADDGPWLMTAAFGGILAFYWIFFLRFLGRTAGMTWMGLRVLNFDCRPPDETQRRNRAFGTILSAAAVGLGFLWALADEQNLTWHDRMSKTFVALDPADGDEA